MTNDTKRGGLTRQYYFKMTPELYKRIEAMRERETKRNMYPVSIASVVRKCVNIGLERMESTK